MNTVEFSVSTRRQFRLVGSFGDDEFTVNVRDAYSTNGKGFTLWGKWRALSVVQVGPREWSRCCREWSKARKEWLRTARKVGTPPHPALGPQDIEALDACVSSDNDNA